MSLITSLNPIFAELKLPNKDRRQRASLQLYSQVVTAHKGKSDAPKSSAIAIDWIFCSRLPAELASDKFLEFYSAINHRIAQYVVISTDTNEKIGGIIAIQQLIKFDGDDAAQRTTRYAGYLRAALRSNDNDVLVYAAEALGMLATPGGALTAELVESEAKAALEWLQVERQEPRRFASVLIIRELAKRSPTLLYTYVPQVLECIWVAVRDARVLIRETAAEAVAECFDILNARDAVLRHQWFSRMYQESLQGIKSNNIDSIHGSLLIIKDLLQIGGLFMKEHYREACEIAMRFKDHRDVKIRAEIVLIIPILANFTPSEFSQTYLHKFMVFLQGQLKKEKERSAAFIAIGHTATATGSAITPYLDTILIAVRDGLSHRAKSRGKDGAVFNCISMLASAMGQTLTKYMEALMDPIFACGLSEPLTQAMVDLAHYVSPVKPVIQVKLLDLISLVLCGRPFKPVGCPDSRWPPLPAFAKDWVQNGITHGEPEIALALHTLGSFDFGSGLSTDEFLNEAN